MVFEVFMLSHFLWTVKSSVNNITDGVHAQTHSRHTNNINWTSPQRSPEQLSTKADISTEMSALEAQSIIGAGNIADLNYNKCA